MNGRLFGQDSAEIMNKDFSRTGSALEHQDDSNKWIFEREANCNVCF